MSRYFWFYLILFGFIRFAGLGPNYNSNQNHTEKVSNNRQENPQRVKKEEDSLKGLDPYPAHSTKHARGRRNDITGVSDRTINSYILFGFFFIQLSHFFY